MLSLEKYLTQSHAPASFGAGVQHLAQCSLFAARMLSKHADLLQDLLDNHAQNYALAQMQQFLAAIKIEDETSLKKRLRQLRQRVILRTMYRDLNGLADLNEVLQTTSELAEISLQTAVSFNMAWLRTNSSAAAEAAYFACDSARDSAADKTNGFIVVGMGKLGGSELNVSSDIDLIFTYDENQNWPAEVSQQDFYNQLAKKVIAALDEITEDGFVFRVDMRLRPFGSEGVLVPSLDALEDYYQSNGREWERYAWIKGRVIYPNNDALQVNIHALLRPFIFRKYLDYNALASMRELKLQIHRDVLQKGQTDNIKLGRGGIREIEFIAQVFQLMRGGRDASLQIKPTLAILNLLKKKALLQENVVDELLAAYVFLRNLEHRLMYVDDQQTQALPTSEEAKARIVSAMSFANWETFLAQLNLHRAQVATHFDATFNEKFNSVTPNQNTIKNTNETAIWQNNLEKTAALQAMLDAGYSDAEQSYSRLHMLRESARYKNLPEQSRQRFDALMPLVIQQAALEKNADDALLRSIVLLENICRRASYLALFVEYPQTLHVVIKLCAASPWLAQYLTAHPILLDELLDAKTLYAAPDFVQMKQELTQNMQALVGDTEAQMDAMRHFKHVAIMRFAAQDVAGQDITTKLQLETLSDYLSALADMILQVSLQTIWQSFKYKHIETPKFAVIGYGKLGGKELGYVSDLDIIFLYDDPHPEAADIYARFAQRINNWFNSMTNAGLLYETDLQLRPDGNSGLLVSSVEAFREYQQHKAWVWEHQALTRARFVAGDADIGEAFEQIRRDVLRQPRDAEKLKFEVVQMRDKLRAAQKINPKLFDLKHSVGGIIDVEFIVQYMVLNYANKHAQLADNYGNIALLKTLSKLNIIDKQLSEQVANAYREYRKLIHASKLQEKPATLLLEQIRQQQSFVIALWQSIF